jgi:hypothetical protein
MYLVLYHKFGWLQAGSESRTSTFRYKSDGYG